MRATDVTVATENTLVPRERIAQMVQVRDVDVRDGVVTGKVTNTSDQTLKDVHLLVRHLWLWKNEMRPGQDDRSRSDEYVVPGEIPPRGTVAFEYRAGALSGGSDGHFEVVVEPVSLVAFADRESRGRTATNPPADGRPSSGTAPY